MADYLQITAWLDEEQNSYVFSPNGPQGWADLYHIIILLKNCSCLAKEGQFGLMAGVELVHSIFCFLFSQLRVDIA